MSRDAILTAWQLFHSHIVSCSTCKPYVPGSRVTEVKEGVYEVNSQKLKRPKLCAVGSLLLAKARQEGPSPDKPPRAKSFPFVAKLHEKIKAHIGSRWQEATVKDRSLAAPFQYQKKDEKTGQLHWRTAASTVMGYEVETQDGERHYVRPTEIKPLVPIKRKERLDTVFEIRIEK